ncbi:MAG: 16S rRNA (cytidine(1402)-2'-O)-methyltransferase [Bacilli bacterium]
MIQNSYNNQSSLYLLPTPIGNFEDITIRTLNLLEKVDYVLCEDTRVTRILLNHFNIKKKLVSCHEHNEDIIKKQVLIDVKNGLNIGLVTDQGSPILSDPGYKVVEYLAKNGVNVIGLPGATAAIPALMVSGIDSTHFLFYGFLNSKSSKRIKELNVLKSLPYTLVFYEAVHRINDFLQDVYKVFGDRNICICRELTKIHEEIYRGTIKELLDHDIILKGEFVIVIEGNNEVLNFSDMSIVEHVKMYIDEGNNEKDAIKLVAKDRNEKKSDIYKQYHLNK